MDIIKGKHKVELSIRVENYPRKQVSTLHQGFKKNIKVKNWQNYLAFAFQFRPRRSGKLEIITKDQVFASHLRTRKSEKFEKSLHNQSSKSRDFRGFQILKLPIWLKVSVKCSELSRFKKGNTFYKNIIDAEATEKGALSDKSARITFPISLSMHRLQKILYNKNNAEKVENNSAHTYHGTTLVINILSSPVGAQGLTNYGVSNFGIKSQSLNLRAKKNSEFQKNASAQTKDQHHMWASVEHYGNMEIKA